MKTSTLLEQAIEAEDWKTARRLIRESQKSDMQNHWLMTRLATTFYEEKNYAEALSFSEKALALAPDCPLVLWDYACVLDMMDREREAISIWHKLLARGVERIAFDECGEGLLWAESLINDCRYRLALAYRDIGKPKEAIRFLEEHLQHRRPGLPSIYPLRDARALLQTWVSAKSKASGISA